MPLFRNIPDFRNNKSTTLDIFIFVDIFSMFIEKKKEVFFLFRE